MQTNNEPLIIGTHNGIFHSDEVVAISLLKILYENIKQINVIRSRDLKMLKTKCTLLIDIGGGKFDHHQKGGNGMRGNGIPYASAGLIWKTFGKTIIKKLTKNCMTNEDIQTIFEIIDKRIIEIIDAEDNGIKLNKNNFFSYIITYLPSWNEENINYDEKFNQVLEQTTNILFNALKYNIANILGMKEIERRILDKTTMINNVLIIPSQTIPWLEPIIEYNTKANIIDFVVFPYPDGGYAIQCVPLSLENNFSQRIPLPEEWAGETTHLSEISHVETAILCHKGRFFARAKTLNDVLKMAQISTKIYKENNDTNTLTLKKNNINKVENP